MLFSTYFRLDRLQAELDFVDVDLDDDQPLFLDPYALQIRGDVWSTDCAQTITLFFQALIDAIRANDDPTAFDLLSELHEPRETRLGLSQGHHSGSAIGQDIAAELLAALKQSRAVQTGFLRDLADAELFVPNVGPDRISDLTTNLIRRQLIEYTQQQCAFHGVPLVGTVASGPMWDVDGGDWYQEHTQLPVANGEKVLLVPKRTVRWHTLLASSDYYNNFVLNHLQARELRSPSLGLVKLLRDGRRKVTKKSLRELFPGSKDFLLQFSQENPQVLEEYKRTKAAIGPLADSNLDADFDERLFATALANRLRDIPPGNEAATQYHRFVKGTLEFIFYPRLTHPKIEDEINEGRKRIDITFLNADRDGFFHRFPSITRRPAIQVIVECKNYTRDLANPEVDQIAGRFADHRGWLGLLLSRQNQDPDQLLARCRDAARAGHGYILPLDDNDLFAMLSLISGGRRDQVTGRLDLLLRELTR